MDIWLFAAAAGAGCVAQQWEKLRKSKQILLDSVCTSSSLVLPEALQAQEVVQGENLFACDSLGEEDVGVEKRCFDQEEVITDTSMAETASSSKRYKDSTDEMEGVKGVVSLLPHTSSSGFTRKRKGLTCRRTKGQSLRPLTSLESCVMAQFHKEQGGAMDDYNIHRLCSPHTPNTSPYLVARNGNSVITRTVSDVYGFPNGGATISTVSTSMDTFSQQRTSISGVPHLPTYSSKELQRNSESQKKVGLSDKTRIFLIGVSFGIMSSFWANKQEMDKLNGMLKTSENLVQDLQEELEMKETLTVKELEVEEDYEKRDKQTGDFDVGTPHNGCEGKAEEKCFSTIEAELEAELERLELNMSACRLSKKASDMVGLDEEGYIPDIADGELKVKIFNRQDNDSQPYADLDGSGSSPVHPADYAVSPRELSLRLHEVIQSRLERRIKELEAALEKRQSKDQFMESEYWREFSNSNSESSSIQASPVLDAVEQQNQAADQSSTVVDEPNTPSTSKGVINMQEEAQYTWIYNARLHNSIARKNPLNDETKQESTLLSQPQEKGREEDGIFTLDFISSEDEEEDGNEEMEKMLIQHIVEQARKGSPVVLNAQKMLFSPVVDDDDDDDEP